MNRMERLERENKTLKGQLERRTRFLGKARVIKVSTNWNDAHQEFTVKRFLEKNMKKGGNIKYDKYLAWVEKKGK